MLTKKKGATTLADAYQAYGCDPKKNLPDLADALYEARGNPDNAAMLCWLCSELEANKSDIISPDFDRFYQSLWLERVERLVTQFAWMSQQTRLPEADREQLAFYAQDICDTVLESREVPQQGPHAHLYYRLLLTFGEVSPDSMSARDAIKEVAHAAPRLIFDAKQRALIYVRLGKLMRREAKLELRRAAKLNVSISGLRWRIRACFVRRIPLRLRVRFLIGRAGA